MTTLNLAQIPSDINTVEQLALWCGYVMRDVAGNTSIIEQEGLLPERVAQVPTIESPSHGVRHVVRVSIEMDPAHTYDQSKKLWRFAQEQVSTTLPAHFTQN